jgi:hypothetical protein
MKPWFTGIAVIAAGVSGLSLASCAEDPWVKPGATQQDAARDANGCEREADHGIFGGGGFGASGAVGSMNRMAWVERCIRAKGYTRTTDSWPVPSGKASN